MLLPRYSKTFLVLKPLSSCALAHSFPWVKQMLENKNLNIIAKNVFIFCQHLASAKIMCLSALHVMVAYRKTVPSWRLCNTNRKSSQRVGEITPPESHTPDILLVNYIKFYSGVWQWKAFHFVSHKVHLSFWKSVPPKMALRL